MKDNKTDLDIESLTRDYLQLKNQERKFREMIDMLPETVFEVNLDGKVIFTNDAGLKLFGYSKDEIDRGVEIRKFFYPTESAKVEENYRQVMLGERNQSTEYMAIKKDGSVFPVLVHALPIFQDNKPVGLRGMLFDISANYEIRKELEREKNFISSLLDTANSLILCLDSDRKIIVFNKECERVTGYAFTEIRNNDWRKVLFPDEAGRRNDFGNLDFLENESVARFESPLLTKTGEIRYILWSYSSYSYSDPGEKAIIAIGHDITERKEAEKNLEESERHYRAVWDNLPVGICLTDRDGIYRYVNPAYCRIYGYKKEELIGRPPDGLIFPATDYRERKKHYNKRFDQEIRTPLAEYNFHKSDGRPVWVEVSSDFIRENGRPKFLISINIDVTKRKSAESALKESEQRYSLLCDHATEGVSIVNSAGVFEMVNTAAAKSMGGLPDDFIGKTVLEIFPRKMAERHMRNILRAIEKSESILIEDFTYIDGEKRWFRIGIYPITIRDGASSALLIASEISLEKKRKVIMETRFRLLDNLRGCEEVDECLEFGCMAIKDAGLFKRSVLTMHNEKREIIHLGQVGLDLEMVEKAKKGKAPDKKLVKQIIQRKYKISHSYFIPTEAGIDYRSTDRYISGSGKRGKKKNFWKKNDELFVPVFGQTKDIEGWLSVDTPYDGKRPDFETVRLLEEICDIVMQRSRQIMDRNKLSLERKALQEKNIALKEILGHIEEEKADFKQRIAESVDQYLLPVLSRIIESPEKISRSNLIVLSNSLKDLSTISGGITQLYSKLSPREIEVCNLIKLGNTSKEIAETLNISPATVQKHREQIRRKLGLTNKDVNLPSHLKNL